MLAPPLKLLGGGPGPPWPPLFLRLCVSHNMHRPGKKLGQTNARVDFVTLVSFVNKLEHFERQSDKSISVEVILNDKIVVCNETSAIYGLCSITVLYRKNSKYWDTQTSYRSCP